MIRSILVACALMTACVTADAMRVMEQPERPYELSLAQISLPTTTSGALTVKPCESCPYSTHVLTSATAFYVNNALVPFAEFGRIAEEITGSRRERVHVNVFVDVESGRVTRVKLRDRTLQ